jgi:hypothetical protein
LRDVRKLTNALLEYASSYGYFLFVELKFLILRTIHAGLLAQMDHLKELIEPINEEHTLIAHGQIFILTNGARASMDPCDWYTFRWMRRTMWHSVFPRNPDEYLFNLWIDNGMITRLIPYDTEIGVINFDMFKSIVTTVS